MNAFATNTFATVCFDKKAQFDFESLVTEFQQALDDGTSAPARMRRVGEQFVSFDMGRAQLSLAYSSASTDPDNQRQHQASLAVSVGAGDRSSKSMSFEERVRFCNGVLDRIEAAYARDHRVWDETNREILPFYNAEPKPEILPIAAPATPKRVRKLAAGGRRSRPGMLDSGAANCDCAIGAVAPEPALFADRVRQSRSGATKQPRPLPRQVALGLPQTESRDLTILRNVFLPEHDIADGPATDRPVAHRLAIYTMNTSLMVICLPVGAAMFSYCALGRENLNVVGRVMALTGIGIALANSSFLSAVLPLIG
jgi:hypothetical protein